MFGMLPLLAEPRIAKQGRDGIDSIFFYFFFYRQVLQIDVGTHGLSKFFIGV